MGLFDFLKKKEFEEIRTLKEKLEKFKSSGKIEITIYDKEQIENAIISNLDTQKESLI